MIFIFFFFLSWRFILLAHPISVRTSFQSSFSLQHDWFQYILFCDRLFFYRFICSFFNKNVLAMTNRFFHILPLSNEFIESISSKYFLFWMKYIFEYMGTKTQWIPYYFFQFAANTFRFSSKKIDFGTKFTENSFAKLNNQRKTRWYT